ncbi:hypothetical protein [Natrinema sp. SYSU A 869]|uniref:hypothetical protein n=1 Tax=Natrinema sp. SYSU A 869 TaxID=2871694 RepID=UPI001CA3FAAE|nr:hypothetical protein [Natrinema sp. SYSU A 869]
MQTRSFDGILLPPVYERIGSESTASGPIPLRVEPVSSDRSDPRPVNSGEPFIAPRRVGSFMTRTTYQCPCGAHIEFKQDLEKEFGIPTPDWKCKDCGTLVPGMTAEKIRHQHPS